MKKSLLPLGMLCLLFFSRCNNDTDQSSGDNNTPRTPIISYNIVSTHPHDTSYFTEGLEFYNGNLLESTGNYGQSKLVLKDLQSDKILKETKLDDKYFGEGVTVFNDTVYQLTYKENEVLVYNVKDFKLLKKLRFNGEGWGLTNDGQQLIASNGSNNLYFYQPGTFKLLRTQPVTDNGAPAVNLNELEYINGFVYANQWQYNYILKIDPKSGEVVGKMDFTDLIRQVKAKDPNSEFFNGIAYNPETKKVYITGKNWPQIFEVQFSF
jgi:glutamine cyclotransferase